MKAKPSSKDSMLKEYNFDYSKAKTNRFSENYHYSVMLDSDVANVFQNSESVNKALRAIISAMPELSENTRIKS